MHRCVWLDTRLHVVITQDPTPTSLSTFWIGNVESSSNHLQATTPQLAMGKLLCSLSIEDSSLERLPASILITSLTEIWKSLFSTLPYSFSCCPMVLTSCCSLISAQINPQHTWWDFQYSSQFQKAKIELSLCKSSSCYHQCRFDPYQSQSVYMDMRPFGYCWVWVTIPRSKQCFRHCVCPQQSWQQVIRFTDFSVSLQVTVPSGSHWAAAVHMHVWGVSANTQINNGQCGYVHSNHRNTEKAVVYSDCSTGFGYKLETILRLLLLSERWCNVNLQLWGFSRSCSDTYCSTFRNTLLQEIYTRQSSPCVNSKG